MAALQVHYTTSEVATSRGVNVTKVLAWIDSGELKAVNCAKNRNGLPRWKIPAEALAAFDRARASTPSPPPAKARGRKLNEPTEYVK